MRGKGLRPVDLAARQVGLYLEQDPTGIIDRGDEDMIAGHDRRLGVDRGVAWAAPWDAEAESTAVWCDAQQTADRGAAHAAGKHQEQTLAVKGCRLWCGIAAIPLIAGFPLHVAGTLIVGPHGMTAPLVQDEEVALDQR